MSIWGRPLLLRPDGIVTGDPATFPDGDGSAFKALSIDIFPAQAGIGDPSPDNIRPISGWSGVNVWDEATHDTTANPKVSIAFPSPPGTIYGGTLDVLTGVLTDYGYFRTFDGTESWETVGSENKRYAYLVVNSGSNIIYAQTPEYMACSHLPITQPTSTNNIVGAFVYYSSSTRSTRIVARLPSSYGDTSATVFKSFLADQYAAGNPYQFYFRVKAENATTYQLTPTQVQSLIGANAIWADCGPVTAQYQKQSMLHIS